MKLSQKVSIAATNLYHRYKYLFFPSTKLKVECPYCGWRGMEFLPNGTEARKNARCPKCGSLERHRLYYLFLKKMIITDKKIKVLHFAPEKILTGLLRSYKNIEYLSADIDPAKAMQKEDITGTSFPEATFDLIFCSHVLEHIPDDHKAISELRRILKPDGLAIVLVPIKDKYKGRIINKTFEDFSITDPKEREKVFGQHDHVRIYGRDYKDRLEKAGFKVTVDKFAESLSSEIVSRYALIPHDPTCNETDGWVYCCRK
jgi:SAM-dependent methyltransferase